MTDAAIERERLPVWLGWARLGIALAQGFALYALYYFDDPLDDPLQNALAHAAIFAPMVLVLGLGALRPITLAVWTVIAALICAWLGWHDFARYAEGQRFDWEQSWVWMIAAVLLFVGHDLVSAGDQARKVIAPYEHYFDLGSRTAAQLLLALLFVGAFWLVLHLGGSMFDIIGIDALNKLMQQAWFYWPANAVVFTLAVHLTDLRSGLVRGARALGLILLSWLLPAMTGLAIAFLLALPFTGLQPLWATRNATMILLGAAATLVVLINAAYQDGVSPPGPILRWSTRVASVVITPLAALAAYALYLRIAQYGLTPERIYAGAIFLVGLCYAVPYLIAAFWPRWMKPLEIGNIVSAFVVLAMGLALFTPIADPARLSVADQMNRLRQGLISAESFDVGFLRFQGGRYGIEALNVLRADQSNENARALARRAERAATAKPEERWAWETMNPARLLVRMHPEGAVLPENFSLKDMNIGAICSTQQCDGYLLDVTGDGRTELTLADPSVYQVFVFEYDTQGLAWRPIASAALPVDSAAAASRGDVQTAPSELHDLVVGGTRVPLSETYWGARAARLAAPDDALEEAR